MGYSYKPNKTKNPNPNYVPPMSVKKIEYENIVIPVSNYATDSLQDTLTKYGQSGFKLVNVAMAENKYGVDVMYLFFTRELRK